MFFAHKVRIWLLALFFIFSSAQISLAASTTIIPKEVTSEEKKAATGDELKKLETQDQLAKKFRTGRFELYDLGTYVQYLIELLIFFAGGISVLFIVIGGYKYMIGSMSDDKEAGKKTIGYALGGFAVSVLAWTIVNFLQVWLTSG